MINKTCFITFDHIGNFVLDFVIITHRLIKRIKYEIYIFATFFFN